eukprot:10546056-Alexandrium_andersonii.AAC.1
MIPAPGCYETLGRHGRRWLRRQGRGARGTTPPPAPAEAPVGVEGPPPRARTDSASARRRQLGEGLAAQPGRRVRQRTMP